MIERFLGVKHVKDTTSEAIKKGVVEVLSDHGLAIARIRGQGYDGASNMRGEFNGVQKLIRDDNPYAFYICPLFCLPIAVGCCFCRKMLPSY